MVSRDKYTFRKLMNDIHLWLGLASGIIIFIVCLTGTILAFEKEIEAVFAEEIIISAEGDKKSVEELANSIESADLGTITGFIIPTNTSEAVTFYVKKDPEQRRSSQVLIDPYTAQIYDAPKSSASDFMFSMFKLHRWLLLDTKVGRPIVGVATIIFLILSISGLYMWFPKKIKWKTLKNGLKVKSNASWKRINHDLHNTLGFYSLIFIVIMSITGLCWSFPGYRTLLSNVIGTQVFNRTSVSFENLPKEGTLTYSEAIALANKELDYEGKLRLSMPTEKNNYYTFYKYKKANLSPVTSDKLYMDRTGKVLEIDYFADKPLNVQFASLIKPIHTGEIFGFWSKLIYFIACLIGTSLPVTGTIIWLNKMKKKKV